MKKRCALAGANEAKVKAGKSNSKADKTCVGGEESECPVTFGAQFEPVHVNKRCDGSKCEERPFERRSKERA